MNRTGLLYINITFLAEHPGITKGAASQMIYNRLYKRIWIDLCSVSSQSICRDCHFGYFKKSRLYQSKRRFLKARQNFVSIPIDTVF